MKCNAPALARYAIESFPGADADVVSIDSGVLPNGSSASPMGDTPAESTSADPLPTEDALRKKQGDPQVSDAPQASSLDRKLSLESVLRSL
jgi:hypothetical protein